MLKKLDVVAKLVIDFEMFSPDKIPLQRMKGS